MPQVWVKVPIAIPSVLWTSRQKGLKTSGSAGAGAKVSVLFKALNAFHSVSVQVRGIVPPSVLVCGGFALSANSGIQRWQYLTTPKNSRTSLFVFWSWDRKNGRNPTLGQAPLASPQLVAKLSGF